MRLPARALTGHLVWGRDGAVWACWRLAPTAHAWLPATERLRIWQRLRGGLMQLPPESMLLSVCRRVDPGEVVARMLTGVDLEVCAAWQAEAAATGDRLAGTPLTERRHYLAARLPGAGWRDSLGLLAAARDAVAERFGVAGLPPRADAVAERVRQAAALEARLAGSLDLERVSAGELRWLYARAFRRGQGEPYPHDDAWTHGERTVTGRGPARIVGPALAPLADAVVYEGGCHDDAQRPRHRRYLRIDTTQATSYQALLALADLPAAWTYPGGGEWFAALDTLPFGVDWCARIRAVDNAEAQAKTRRQARQLAGQFAEHDGDVDGIPAELADAVAGVDAEHAALAANRGEPELQTTVVMAVWADGLDELEGRCAQLASLFTAGDYTLGRPSGGQAALFTAMLPGNPTPTVARDYTQFLLPGDLASGLPTAGVELGAATGMLLGESRDVAAATPVHFDAAAAPRQGRSGSLGVAGALGSGKSYMVKRLAHATLARGGQVVALDRTQRGEYVAFADVAPGASQVVRLAADAPVSLDPLRMFAADGDAAAAAAVGFLTLLAQVAPTDLEGVAIAEAVEQAAAGPHATLAAAMDALQGLGETDEDARTVWRKLRALGRNRLARLAFDPDPTRQVARPEADYLVFHTPGLALPTREELLHPHLARQLLPEQLVSQALLYLVAAVMRQLTWADWGRFAAGILDEAWALTASLQGRQLIGDLIRDGRKHNAAVWLGSQHADDLGDDQLAHLLGARFVFRTDPGAIPAACRFLGIDHSEQARGLLEHAEAGVCLLRDAEGRIGCVQISQAAPALHAAFDTTPTTRTRRDEGDEAEPADGPASGVVALPTPNDSSGDGEDGGEGWGEALLA